MLLIVFQAKVIKVQFLEAKEDMWHPGHREYSRAGIKNVSQGVPG